MTTYTNTIGTGSDFATLSLYWNTSATAIASGDVLVAEFLGGTHSIGATYNNTFSNLVGVDLVMRPVASAMHNGNWNEGVRIEPQTGQTGQMYFQSIGNQDFSLRVEDLVWINPTGENGRIYVNFDPTLGSGAQYDATLSFERCLIHASGSNPYGMALNANNYDVSSGGAGVSALGNATISVKNCVIEGFKDDGDVTRCFRSLGTTNFTYSAIGCTFQNATLYYINTASAVENLHVHGCMFNQTGNLMQLGWEGFNTVAGSTSSFSDIIWTRTNQAGYVGDNWTTGASFNYDGTVTSGEVCFVGPSGPEGNYRLVADVDNLAIKYATSSTIPTLDAANKARCELTDAGAFQSISSRVISSEVGASSSGHPRDGDYATVSLWRASIPTRNSAGEASALNGDIYEAVLLEGDHEMWVGGSFDSRLDFTTRFKGDVSHNGVRGAGAQLIQPTRGQLYSYGEHDISYEFEDLSILWGGPWMWFRTYDNTLDHTASVTCNKCMLLGDVTVDQSTLEITSNTSATRYGSWIANGFHTVGTVDYTFKNSLLLVGDNIARFADKGHLDIQGCTFYAHHESGRIFNGGTDLTASIKGTIAHIGSTRLTPDRNIPLLNSFNSSNVTCTDYLSDEFNLNWVDASNTTNSSANIVFNYDGTVTSGQVNYLASGDSGDLSSLDYRLVSDNNNLAVKYVDNTILPTRDVANGVRPHFADAGAYQSSSTNVNDYYIGTDYATFLLWHADRKNSILNGETERLIYPSGIYVDPGHTTWIKDFDRVNFDLVLKADTSAYHNGDWDSGVIFSSVNTDNKFDFAFYEGHSVNVTFDGLVRFRKEQVGGRIITYPAGEFSFFAPTRQSADYDRSLTLKNCLTHHTGFTIAADGLNNFAYDIDASGNITRRGKNTLTLENCVYDVAPLGSIDRSWQTLASLSYGGSGHSVYNFKSCTFTNVGISHSTYANEVVDINIEGVISRSGYNLGADLFFFSPPSQATINSNGYFTDSYVTHLSGTNFYNNLDILYDGQAPESSGAISFLGASAWETSTPGDYRLTPHVNNLPVEYLTQYVDDLKIPTLDVANYPRPSKTDAGAYQSITNVVSSFEIGSIAAGHSRDGDYATVPLWLASERSNMSNGDTLELILLEGDHTIGGITYSNFNQVNFDLVFKGETPHNGYWTSGAELDFTSYGNRFFFDVNQENSSRVIKFEDLLIKFTAGETFIADTRTTSDEYHSNDFEFNRLMVSATQSSNQFYRFTGGNGVSNNVTINNCTFDVFKRVFGTVGGNESVGAGSLTMKGCSIRTTADGSWINCYHNYNRSSLIEGCIFDGNPVRQFVWTNGGGSGVTFKDCITSEGAVGHSNQIGTGSSVNVTTDASFNYSGTFDNFVPGEATFVEGSSVFVPYADTRNPIVNNATNSTMPTTDITGAERDSLPDIGAYEAVFIPVSSTLLVTPINLYN